MGFKMKNKKTEFNLWSYVGRNGHQYFILAFLLMIWEIAQIVGGIYEGNAITSLTNRNLPSFLKNESIAALGYIVFVLFMYITGKYGAVVLKNVDNLVRGDLAELLSTQEYEEFKANNESDYLSWFSNDINLLNQNGFRSLVNTFNAAVLVLFSIIVLLSYPPILLITTIIFAVIMILFPKIFQKQLGELSAKQSEQNQVLMTRLNDVLEGFINLLMLNRRKLISQTVQDSSEKAGQALVNYESKSNLSAALTNLISVCAQITLTFESGYLAFHQQIPIGGILIVESMSGKVFGGLTTISFLLTNMRAVQPIFDKYREFKKIPKIGTKQVGPLHDAIKVSNLSYRYNENSYLILNNLNQTIKQGEHVAIVGPSGCGKSTLVKLMAGLLTGYEGSLTWDGVEYRNIDRKSLRQQLAYIDQSAYIFDGSLKFNLTLGQAVSADKIDQVIEQAGLEKFVNESPNGLDTVLKHAGNNISGGQKQRIALARSLITEPKVVLADEITSAIDEKDGQKIEQGLLDLQGITLVYISHHLRPEIKSQFNQVIELEQK